MFDTYVRANSVLLTPSEAGTHQIGYPRRWSGPWLGEEEVQALKRHIHIQGGH